MAAAESHLNETSREHLQPEKPAELLQNGGADNGVEAKAKSPYADMSQYRELGQHQDADDGKEKYLDNGDYAKEGYLAYSPRYGHTELGDGCNNLHPNNQFGVPRHPFAKGRQHANYAPPQRFMSGQSISQQMGPTPTLNQLLQSSNSAHRYQNNSYEYAQKPEAPQPYNHGWNARPMAPYMNQQAPVYRNQMPNTNIRCGSVGAPPGPGGSGYPQQPPPGASAPGPPTSSYPPHPQPPSSPSHQPQQPSAPQQYPPYPQRYPTPPNVAGGPPQQGAPVRVPAYPAPHHQMGSPYGPMGQGPNMQSSGSPYPGEQRVPWPPMPQQQQQQQSQPNMQPQQQQQHGPNSSQPSQSPQHASTPQPPSQSPHIPPSSPVPPAPSTPTPHSSSSTPQQHSPQSALTSPQPAHPEPSPQQSHQPHQSPQHSTQFHGGSRHNLSSTTPEPGDLASQNSNDSSSGGGPQAMRPTPSPTGSTGSRSMSPAIGQQNIPMPPRPSSGQSDSGSTSSQSRLSHSPMAPTQGGYQQQPLAPPPHMHNYKMGSGGPQGPMHPGNMIPNPSGGPPYSQMPPSHQPFNQQGGYPGRGVQNMPPYHQNYGMIQPGAGGHGQYPARPMPNHVPHSQYPGFQGWPSPNVNVPNSPSGSMSMGGPGAPSPSSHTQSPISGKSVPPPASSPQHQPQAQSLQPPGPPHQSSNQHHPMHMMHQHQPHQQQQQQPPPSQQQQPPAPSPHPQQPAPQSQQQPPPQQQQPPPSQQQQQPQSSPQSLSSQPPQSPQLGQNCSSGPRSHTPPQYLKQHLQHKVGFNNTNSGMPPSPGPPPGMYGNSTSPGMGPPHHHPMAPPVPGGHHHMGAVGHPMTNMMPPHGNSHHDGPMPPPSSTPNSHSLPTPSIQSDSGMDGMHDGGPLTTTASGNLTNVSQMNSGGITSVITTGPDGAPIDEASQQSTLSNTSAASSEDPSSTPKRKESGMSMMGPMGGGYMGHGHSQVPVPPCSPGMNSMHDDYPPEGNQPWNRTPSSPVYNSHTHQEVYRSTKKNDIGKLYEMDDNPERRIFLDKLLHFMEERGTPIPTCPSMCKTPLDLFRLYVLIKDRGGFMEVCKVTKNKVWKDIAGLLGMGASASAAYTLRKNYTKLILPFECHFDRGGIDPQPIIASLESTSKKNKKNAASVPSPAGSSNSQDSFPAGPSGAMDGYSGYNYPNEYANQRGPPNMPGNQALPSQPGGYQGQPGYNQYPPDQYGQQYMSGGSYPPSRPMYPVYPPEMERGYSQNNSNSSMGPNSGPQQQPAPSPAVASGPASSDPYNRSPYGQPMYHPRPPFSGPNQSPQPSPGVNATSQSSNSHVVPSPPRPDSQPSPSPYPPSPQQQQQQQPPQSQQTQAPPSQAPQSATSPHLPPQPQQQPPSHQPSPAANQQTPPQSAPQQPQQQQQSPQQQQPHEFYRPDQPPFPNQNTIPSAGSNAYPGANKGGMPPPSMQQPRRHPDFSKESQQSPPPNSYPPYNNQQPQRPPNVFPGWSNDNANRGPYPRVPYTNTQGNVPTTPPQQWNQGPMPRPPVPNAQPPNAQWDRYPANSQQQQFPPQTNQWNSSSTSPVSQNANVRPPRPPFRSDRPFPPGVPTPAQPITRTPPSGPMPPQAQPSPQLQPSPQPQPAPPAQPQQPPAAFAGAALRREPVFPADSVEATLPLYNRRKRLAKGDVAPVDAWKLLMSLRSGLLTETCWALDVLNILLFDETGVQYFGLAHLPGLLDVLLELFNRSLDDMLEASAERADRRWYEKPARQCHEPDLGRIAEPAAGVDPDERLPLRTRLPDYTLKSRRGLPVAVVDGGDDLFVRDGPRAWEGRELRLEDVCQPDAGYIVPCFRSEFGLVPFARLLPPAQNGRAKRGKGDASTDGDINHWTKRRRSGDVAKCEPSADDVRPPTVKTEPADEPAVDCAKVEPRDDDVEREAIDGRENGEVAHRGCKLERVKRENGDEDEAKERSGCHVLDPMGVLRKRKLSQYEDECYTRDEASLYLVTDTQDAIARRCICLSTILRNLTFIPGNEPEFAKNSAYLALMGKLLLVHHEHPLRTHKQQNYDREDDADLGDCCSSLNGGHEWWWDFLHQIRENVLVSVANISGHVDLSNYLEEVSRPVLDGLLHWAVCPAAQGQDPFPTAASLSPQKLALEALCKLCVTDANVDLVIATPPYSRLEKLTGVLTKLLCRNEEQVLREFAINLLHYLAAAETSMCRIIALQSPCISLLVAFIEQAEQNALGVANQHGINALRDNPESMGTSLDMLRRAARTLLHLSRHPDNKPLFLQQEQRLLALVMSQILDQQVAGIISQVLYQCSRSTPSPLSSPKS